MVEVKIKNATDLTTLYFLNEWQKSSFTTHVTFKVELIDTFSINIVYNIPTEVKLTMNFDPNSFNEEINEALSGKPVDCIIMHLIVMKIIMEKFNLHLIGLCLDKEIEDVMMKRIEMKHKMELLYGRKNRSCK